MADVGGGAHAPYGGALTEVVSFGANPGRLRMFRHVPEGLSAHAPLVVALHGCGQNALGYAIGCGWIQLADRYGFALLCPEQRQQNNFNTCFNWFFPDHVARGGGEEQPRVRRAELHGEGGRVLRVEEADGERQHGADDDEPHRVLQPRSLHIRSSTSMPSRSRPCLSTRATSSVSTRREARTAGSALSTGWSA